jgi:hypothetical protein
VPAGEAEKEVETLMALLRKAVAMGFRSPDTYRTDDALHPRRGRDDFKFLMMDLAIPAEPFAPALTGGPAHPSPAHRTAAVSSELVGRT